MNSTRLHGFGPEGSDLDRCAERRGDQRWLAAQWSSPLAKVIRLGAEGISVSGDPATVLGQPGDGEPVPQLFLGVDADGAPHFARLPSEGDVDDAVRGERWGEGASPSESLTSLRLVLGQLTREQARLAAYAMGLAQWHARHRFCARCGSITLIAQAGHVRHCPDCGADHYPRTDPAVIVLVTDSADRALLGRQASWPERRFSTLAGFVEPGESLEAAVAREVFEESGVRIGSAHYAASQPWPFPASLMLGYFAQADDQPATADGVELAEVRWFSRDELRAAIESGDVLLPPSTSISRSLIETWLGSAVSR